MFRNEKLGMQNSQLQMNRVFYRLFYVSGFNLFSLHLLADKESYAVKLNLKRNKVLHATLLFFTRSLCHNQDINHSMERGLAVES